jgi:hypothetical protein
MLLQASPTWLVAIEQPLECFEMQHRLLSLAANFVRHPLRQGIGDGAQPFTAALGDDLHHAGSFQVIQIVERVRNRRSADNDAVASEKKHIGITERRAHTVAFGGRERYAIVLVVIGNAPMEAKGVLIRPFEAALFQQGKRGGVRHVSMQNARLVVAAVNTPMDEKRGGLDGVPAFHQASFGVDDYQVGRRHLGPMQALRIDQETAGLPRHTKTEVIAYAFVQAEPYRGTQRGSQIDSGLCNGVKVHGIYNHNGFLIISSY